MADYESMSTEELEAEQKRLTQRRREIQAEAREVSAVLNERLRTDRAKRKAKQDPNLVQRIGTP